MNKTGITARYTDAERRILEDKARKYNYPSLASYIRDISLNEIVIIEDIHGKQEICEELEESRKIMIAQEREIKELIPMISENIKEREEIENLLNEMIYQRKVIAKTIEQKLFKEFIDDNITKIETVETKRQK